jgi:hypothetical protein
VGADPLRGLSGGEGENIGAALQVCSHGHVHGGVIVKLERALQGSERGSIPRDSTSAVSHPGRLTHGLASNSVY